MHAQVLDREGVDIWPAIRTVSAHWGLDPVAYLALLYAESGLNRTAVREKEWPDVSYGYGQMTVLTAATYGIGDGRDTPENRQLVRSALFDRDKCLWVCAQHMARCYEIVRDLAPPNLAASEGQMSIQQLAERRNLLAMRVYNAGRSGLTNLYAEKYPQRVAAYERALEHAREQIAGDLAASEANEISSPGPNRADSASVRSARELIEDQYQLAQVLLQDRDIDRDERLEIGRQLREATLKLKALLGMSE